jgi:O-antigen ligase
MLTTIELAALASIILVGAFIVLTRPGASLALAFLVGAAAGLMSVQVVKIHVFTIVVLIWFIAALRKRQPPITREAIVLLLFSAALASTALYGDLVNSPALGLQLTAFAIAAALIATMCDEAERLAILYGLLAITTLGSLIGLGQVAGIVPSELWHLSISALGRPTGIYPEPDWLGMYSGVGLLLSWRLNVGSLLRPVLLAANALACILAFARAAWIAVAAVILVMAVLAAAAWARRRWARMTALSGGASPNSAAAQNSAAAPSPATASTSTVPTDPAKKSGRLSSLIVMATALIVLITTIPVLGENLVTRLGQTLVAQTDDVSAQARVQQINGLLELASTAPWFGHGISASGRVTSNGRLQFGDSPNNVGSNWLLSLWVDGQLLAVPLMLLLIVITVRTIHTIEGQALLLVLTSSLFSNATFCPVTWALVGLALASIARRRRLVSAAAAAPPPPGVVAPSGLAP